jgi:histone H3/H4
MSTKKVKAPVKPKTVTPVAVVAPAAAKAVTAPVVAPKVVVADTVKASTKRQQTTKNIHVNISAARTRRHMDRINLNKVIDDMLAAPKEKIAAYDTAKTKLETKKLSETVEVTKTVDGKEVKTSEVKERDLTAAELKAAQDTVNEGKNVYASWVADRNALSSERTRFSSEASVALSIICDNVVKDLATHAMNSVLAEQKKIIHPEHLYADGVENLALYALVRTLPSFRAKFAEYTSSRKNKDLEAKLKMARHEAEKEFKVKYAASLSKKKPAAVVVPGAAVVAPVVAAPAVAEADHDEEEEEDESDSKTSFRHYVGEVCKHLVKTTPRYQVWSEETTVDGAQVASAPVLDKKGQVKLLVRISNEMRAHLSDIVVELIARLSVLTQLTADDMKNKTVNEEAILSTVKKLLVDGHVPTETVTLTNELVPNEESPEYKAAQKKRADAKAAGQKVEKLDLSNVPKVSVRVATRKITFPTSSYDALEADVREKLKALNA